jgi:hypothetical protein
MENRETVATENRIVLRRGKKVQPKSTTMRVRTDLYRQLEDLADETGMSVSKVAGILMTAAIRMVDVRD